MHKNTCIVTTRFPQKKTSDVDGVKEQCPLITRISHKRDFRRQTEVPKEAQYVVYETFRFAYSAVIFFIMVSAYYNAF